MTDPSEYMKPSLGMPALTNGDNQQLKDIQNQLTLIDYKLNHVIDGIDQLFDYIEKKIDRLQGELL